MNKKYTVFLSSTYDDLREERREVIDALQRLDCIPYGMETFPADNEEQFEFIKSVIDKCDYYILIIAGRYGSIGKNGKSYTEMEYRYAIKKGIPVLTFIHDNIGAISLEKSEKDEERRKKLEAFIEYTSKGKLVEYWNGKKDLVVKVLISMISTIQRHPSKGWVREDGQIENIPGTFAGENMDLHGKHEYLSDEMYKTAVYYKQQKEFEKSRMFFECCLILNSENKEVLREYGGLYFDNQQYQKALVLWEKLLSMQKSSGNYYLCALASYWVKNYLQAKEFSKKALEYPDDGWHGQTRDLIKKLSEVDAIRNG